MKFEDVDEQHIFETIAADVNLSFNTLVSMGELLAPTLALINEENPELFTVIQAMADRPTKSSWDFVDCCLIIYELMRGE